MGVRQAGNRDSNSGKEKKTFLFSKRLSGCDMYCKDSLIFPPLHSSAAAN